MSMFNGIDYVVFVLLFLSIAIGTVRGFAKEIISLIAWVAAFTVSTLYSIKFAALFVPSASHAATANPADYVSGWAIVVSYMVLFIAVLLLGSLIKFIVNYAVESGGISLTNRLLGAVLGLGRGCVVILLAMFFVSLTAMANGMLWKESKMVEVFKPGVKWMTGVAQPYFSVIEAKMKNVAKGANEELLPDVIKAQPADVSVVAPLKK